MKHTVPQALFLFIFLCAFCVAFAGPSGAVGTLPPPPTTAAPRLFATAQTSDALAYAWLSGGTLIVSEFGPLSSLGSIAVRHPTAIDVVLGDDATPVVAWRDAHGIHTAIGTSGLGPTPPHLITWTYADHGPGRKPQLLTNPLRLVYFARNIFTCQQWTGSAWQSGCEA